MWCAPGGSGWRIARSNDKLMLWTSLLSTFCPKRVQAAGCFEFWVVRTLQDGPLEYPCSLESWTCVFEG